MNTRWMLATLTGLLLAAPLTTVRANEPAPADTHMQGADHGGYGFKNKLDLTDDQKQKMKAIRRDERDALTPLKDKGEDLAKKLRDEVKNNAGDAELEATLKDLKANQSAFRETMEKFAAQRDAVLTPTQRAKMALGMMHRMHHKLGGMNGHDHQHGEDGAPDSAGQTDAQ